MGSSISSRDLILLFIGKPPPAIESNETQPAIQGIGIESEKAGKEYPQQITLGFYIICEFLFYFVVCQEGGTNLHGEGAATGTDSDMISCCSLCFLETFLGAPMIFQTSGTV